MPLNVAEVIRQHNRFGLTTVLPKPAYSFREDGPKFGLAVESMSRHMTDEGWQLFLGLQSTGYELKGFEIGKSETDVAWMLTEDPSVVVLQDKREWQGLTADRSRDPRMAFRNVDHLKFNDDVFRVTVLKDAQHDLTYNREAADEIGCHAWIVYYHPEIVCALSPFVRREHLIRTHHSINKDVLPIRDYSTKHRYGTVISGATSRTYPLRTRIISDRTNYIHYISHPGYHRNGADTENYIQKLTKFRVSICTSSVYGYALRKIVESTLAGCVVVTNLPKDEVLPEIDGNLVRIGDDASYDEVQTLVSELNLTYDPDKQEHFAKLAAWYDYRAQGSRIASEIERLRRNWK